VLPIVFDSFFFAFYSPPFFAAVLNSTFLIVGRIANPTYNFVAKSLGFAQISQNLPRRSEERQVL
jgi:hypothetical protein